MGRPPRPIFCPWARTVACACGRLDAEGLPTGDSPITLAVDGTRITAGDWAADDESVLVGTADGRALSLPLELEVVRANACASAYRNLTPAEWEQYLPAREYGETCELGGGSAILMRP